MLHWMPFSLRCCKMNQTIRESSATCMVQRRCHAHHESSHLRDTTNFSMTEATVKALDFLKKQLDERTIAAKRHYNSFSPSHSLPRELLEDIFLLLIPPYQWIESDIKPVVKQRGRIQGVCRLWNDIVRSSNKLGSVLVNIRGEKTTTPGQSWTSPLSICCGHVVPWGTRCDDESSDSNRILPVYPAQWRHLNLCSEAFSRVVSVTWATDAFRSLTEVCIQNVDSEVPLNPDPFRHMPHLRRLGLHGYHSVARSIPPLSQVTFLQLSDSWLRGNPLLKLLQAMPNLVSLHYQQPYESPDKSFAPSPSTSQIQPLVHLEMLNIHNADFFVIQQILSVVPESRKLQRLEIEGGHSLSTQMDESIDDDEPEGFPVDVIRYLFNNPVVCNVTKDASLVLDCDSTNLKLAGPNVWVKTARPFEEWGGFFTKTLLKLYADGGPGWPDVFQRVPISLHLWNIDQEEQDTTIKDLLLILPGNVVEIRPAHREGGPSAATTFDLLLERPQVFSSLRKIYVTQRCASECELLLRNLMRSREQLQVFVGDWYRQPHDWQPLCTTVMDRNVPS